MSVVDYIIDFDIDIDIADIVVEPDRMRRLRPEKVAELAESIAARGLLHPIIVRQCESDEPLVLVAGRHRFEAVRKNGATSIRAIILEGLDADQAQLVEIDENLIRADLSPAERKLHIAERKRLYEKQHPDTKHGAVGRRGKSRQNGDTSERFTKATAETTGHSERSVQRDVTHAKKCTVLAEIAGTSLDEEGEIEALARLPEDEQRTLAAKAKDGDKVSAKARRVSVPSREEVERIYAERQARPEWVKRRERERDIQREERDQQKRQEQARKQERTRRDLAGFDIKNKAHREIALDLIDAGYRALAKAAHPDTKKDGDGEAMRSLNNARDFLRAMVQRAAP